MDERIGGVLDGVAGAAGRIVFLTGAGISAESGIPTFRGKEGYWTIGSKEYRPMDLATHQAFRRQPEEVWVWYLYRRAVCRRSDPNPGHLALVELEQMIGDRFRLVTQNVDGLHIRAGNDLSRTYQVHGNIDFMRCADECNLEQVTIPESVGAKGRGDTLDDTEREILHCPDCGGWMRPHVLWFDECYDEPRFRFNSSLQAAAEADLLVVVGSSGTTNLPMQVAALAARREVPFLDINLEENPFGQLAGQLPLGAALRGSSADLLPPICQRLMGGAR